MAGPLGRPDAAFGERRSMRRRVEAARDIELLWPSGLGATLTIACGRAPAFRRGVARPVVSAPQWHAARGRHAKRELDAAVVAEWLVGQFPPGGTNGLTLGSPHGAVVHLAMALGVPWLPAAFEVPTPDLVNGEHPAAEGERATRDILDADSALSAMACSAQADGLLVL